MCRTLSCSGVESGATLEAGSRSWGSKAAGNICENQLLGFRILLGLALACSSRLWCLWDQGHASI